jgi:hypothetical protein
MSVALFIFFIHAKKKKKLNQKETNKDKLHKE